MEIIRGSVGHEIVMMVRRVGMTSRSKNEKGPATL